MDQGIDDQEESPIPPKLTGYQETTDSERASASNPFMAIAGCRAGSEQMDQQTTAKLGLKPG